MTTTTDFEEQILSEEFGIDPYPTLHELRETHPVHWFEPWQSWLFTRHEDAAYILGNDNFTDVGRPGWDDEPGFETDPPRTRSLLNSEPPEHTALRLTTRQELTPRAVGEHEPAVQQFIDELLNGIEPPEEFDAIQRLAAPIPTFAVSRAIGVPEGFADLLMPKSSSNSTIDLLGIPAECPHAHQIREQLPERPAFVSPTPLVEDVLWGTTAHGPAEEHSQALQNIRDAVENKSITRDEGIAHVIGVVGAGLDTSKTFAASSLGLLLSHPEELEKLRANPDWIPMALEEVLRYAAPVARIPRRVKEDFEIGGFQIRKNELVMAMVAIANRDPQRFEDPDTFKVDRFVGQRVIGHLTFGAGRHLCVGAHVARQEVQLLIQSLLERFSDISLVNDELEWVPHWEIREMDELPIRIAS